MTLRSVSRLSIGLVLSLMPAAPAPAQTVSGQNQVHPLDNWVITQHEKSTGKCVDCHTPQPANGAWLRRPTPASQINTFAYWTIAGENSRTAGLTLALVDESLRAHIKLPKEGGLVVTAIDPHSSAQQTGIQLNDILIKAGETPLAKPDDLEKTLKSSGEKLVTLQLLRLGKTTEIQVQPQIQVSLHPVPAKPPENQYWIGVSVTPLEPALRSQLQLPDNQGLIVNEVVKDSPASRTDLKVNDILLEVDGKPLSHSANMAELVQSHGEKPLMFHVIRVGKLHLSIEVTPERRKDKKAAANADQVLGGVFGYRFSQPGAVEVLSTKEPILEFHYDALRNVTTESPNSQTDRKQPADGGGGISKRLDALDATIKQLREAIDELSKATKEKK